MTANRPALVASIGAFLVSALGSCLVAGGRWSHGDESTVALILLGALSAAISGICLAWWCLRRRARLGLALLTLNVATTAVAAYLLLAML